MKILRNKSHRNILDKPLILLQILQMIRQPPRPLATPCHQQRENQIAVDSHSPEKRKLGLGMNESP